MKTPIAVVIGDIHFSLSNLELASKSLKLAVHKALKLKVPLIVNGDLTNDKAVVRGEVLNELLSIFKEVYEKLVTIFLNIGNHDLINQLSTHHVLNFLDPYCVIIEKSKTIHLGNGNSLGTIPYCNSNDKFLQEVSTFDKSVILLVHQGLKGAKMGDYYKDSSSVDPNLLSGRRIIASHYHDKQDIELPENGLWSYIGSPYTISHGEANDQNKGFSVLYSDGSLELIRTNLRRHIKITRDIENILQPINNINKNDLLWVQVHGTSLELEKLDKKEIGLALIGHENFKLELIPTETVLHIENIEKFTNTELLDQIIDKSEESDIVKQEVKALWREIVETN